MFDISGSTELGYNYQSLCAKTGKLLGIGLARIYVQQFYHKLVDGCQCCGYLFSLSQNEFSVNRDYMKLSNFNDMLNDIIYFYLHFWTLVEFLSNLIWNGLCLLFLSHLLYAVIFCIIKLFALLKNSTKIQCHKYFHFDWLTSTNSWIKWVHQNKSGRYFCVDSIIRWSLLCNLKWNTW